MTTLYDSGFAEDDGSIFKNFTQGDGCDIGSFKLAMMGECAPLTLATVQATVFLNPKATCETLTRQHAYAVPSKRPQSLSHC